MRKITVVITCFNNETEFLECEYVVPVGIDIILEKYKLKGTDGELFICEGSIPITSEDDVLFYRKFLDIDFDMNKYSYFIECKVS